MKIDMVNTPAPTNPLSDLTLGQIIDFLVWALQWIHQPVLAIENKLIILYLGIWAGLLINRYLSNLARYLTWVIVIAAMGVAGLSVNDLLDTVTGVLPNFGP